MSFTLYSAMIRPHMGYCDVGTVEEVLGRARRAKTLGWGVVSDKHWNCKTTTDILNPPKDAETTCKTRAVHILSLYYSLFISINHTFLSE